MLDLAPLAPADRLFWEIAARFPTRPMICALYLELAGPPDLRRLERRIAAAAAAHPRLAAALVVEGDVPRWRPIGPPTPATLLDDAVDHRERLARLAPRAGDPLAAGGHAWSIEHLADHRGVEARNHGLWIRWHHALTDAEGMLDLLTALTDAGPDDDAADPTRLDPRARGDRKPTIAGAALGPLARLRQATRRLRARPRARGPVGGARVDYRELTILDGDRLAAAAEALGVATHDLLVGVTARALHRLGVEGAAPTRVHAPISARPRDGRIRLGNLGHPLHVVVDGDLADLASHLRALGAANAAAIARAAAPPPWLLGLLPRLPRPLFARVLAGAPRSVANYLPWSDAPRSVAGAPIVALHGLAPLLPFRGCTVAMIGYLRRVRVTLAADPTIHADHDAIAGALRAEFAALEALAGRNRGVLGG